MTCENCKNANDDNATECNKDAYCLDDPQMVSNCCGAAFDEPGWPDTDVCSHCKEHCEGELEE